MTLPLKEQVEGLNSITEYLKHHSPAGQMADLELLSTEDFDADSDPTSPDDEAADSSTPSPDADSTVG